MLSKWYIVLLSILVSLLSTSAIFAYKGLEIIFSDNFESYEVGMPLGEPWEIGLVEMEFCAGYVRIVQAKDGTGKMVEMGVEGEESGCSAGASWGAPTIYTTGTLMVEFEMVTTTDIIIFELEGTASANWADAIFYNGEIESSSGTGKKLCGTYNKGQWYHVRMVSNLDTQTHSVYIDGEPGDCENLTLFDDDVKSKANEDFNVGFTASIGASLYPEYGRFDNVIITYNDGLPDEDDDDDNDDDDNDDITPPSGDADDDGGEGCGC